ncbi:MAG: putative esterase of the alpha-beta hydrolase superfamily [Syntrophaceae bacterium]|nr:MAG: putative esterase of the alpha-beta hydrolase superfamily [Syntrophaceae bacterium]
MPVNFDRLRKFLYPVFWGCLFLFVSCATTPPVAVPLPPTKPAKIAVVLGAGASKGFAHIGVLKVLESHRIPIHMVVGTSVGSFVGSLYAYGYNPFELQTIAFALQKDDLADYIIPDNGFIKGEKLENFVNNKVKYTTIDKFKIPFYAVATNIQTGEEMVFGRGNAGRAVRASCSIPGIFNPVMIGDKAYVDGGVVSPVAIDAARRFGADVVIAVDISASLSPTAPKGTVETMMQAIDVMHNKMAVLQLRSADVVIKPKVGNIGASDFTKRHEAIMEGEKAATEAMPAINQLMTKLRQEGRLK